MAPSDVEPDESMTREEGSLQALVLEARAGDPAAFTRIVRQLQDTIVGYAWGVLRDRQRAALARAVDELPENERTAITLFYMAEMDQAAISTFLEVPVSTIKNRLL